MAFSCGPGQDTAAQHNAGEATDMCCRRTWDGERLDTRTAGAASRDDPQLAPVGEIDRAANTRGQIKDRQQR